MAKHKPHHLRHQAAQIAAAQSAPQRHAVHRQIRSTHRDERQTLSSVDSMAASEQAAIDQARREIKRNTNLTNADRAAALAQLSQDRVNVAAGADYLARSTRKDFAGQRSDLRDQLVTISQEQGANAATALQQLLDQQKANRATRVQTQADAGAAALKAADAAAQLGRDASEKVAGIAADAKAAHKSELEKARDAARKTLTSKGIPTTAAAWQEFQQIVASTEGVDHQAAAQVTQATRERMLAKFAASPQGVNQTLPGVVGGVAQALSGLAGG